MLKIKQTNEIKTVPSEVRDSAVKFAFKQLQLAKAAKCEAYFQFDVAESNKRDAEKQLEEAKRVFAEVSDELWAREQAGVKEAA